MLELTSSDRFHVTVKNGIFTAELHGKTGKGKSIAEAIGYWMIEHGDVRFDFTDGIGNITREDEYRARKNPAG